MPWPPSGTASLASVYDITGVPDAAPNASDYRVEFLDAARSHVQGAYVIPAAARYDLAARVVTRTRELVG